MEQKVVQIEVCCGGIDDVITAMRGGADRIELNSALALGGLTPSLGVLTRARQCTSLPIMAMVRPRSAGFCYSDEEFEAMLCDAKLLVQAGADGIVCGFLTPDGEIDEVRCKCMLEAIGGVQPVFHRAFDFCRNPEASLETLIRLGFRRILTSGQMPSVLQGAQTIRALAEQAAGRIEILPGAGIRPENVRSLVAHSGTRWVHVSASGFFPDVSTDANKRISFGRPGPSYDNCYQAVDARALRDIADALRAV